MERIVSKNCPICSAEVEDSFGIIQCSQCQSVLFVDFSGNIIVGDKENNSNEKEEQHPEFESGSGSESGLGSEFEPVLGQRSEIKEDPFGRVFSSPDLSPTESPVLHPFSESENDFNAVQSGNSIEPSIFSPNEIPIEAQFQVDESSPLAPTVLEIDKNPQPSYLDNNSQPPMESHPIEFEKNNLQTSNSYQNSSPSHLSSSGKLQYTITVSGIDTSELRKILRDTLHDSRLGLVGNEIIENIEQGVLVIKELNPIKASVIVKSLREYPFEIRWQSAT